MYIKLKLIFQIFQVYRDPLIIGGKNSSTKSSKRSDSGIVSSSSMSSSTSSSRPRSPTSTSYTNPQREDAILDQLARQTAAALNLGMVSHKISIIPIFWSQAIIKQTFITKNQQHSI